MNAAVPECLVTGYQHLIASITLPDPGDRHVLAAAVRGRCEVIVTFNGRDFPDRVLSDFGLKTIDPDAFLIQAYERNPEAFTMAVRKDYAHYIDPELTYTDYVGGFTKTGLKRFSAFLEDNKAAVTQR